MPAEPVAENKSLKLELKKAYEVISYMKNKLSEVKLLNAKLLYVNKVFKANGSMTEAQKAKVVETIDKAKTVNEAKLIYTTLTESMKMTTAKLAEHNVAMKKAMKLTEAMGSKSIKSTKPIIAEANSLVSRFQKLADIKPENK